MIRLENVLKTSLQDVLKMSSKRLEDVLKTSWRRLEDVLKTHWRGLGKMSWRCLKNILKISWTCLGDAFARRLENVLKTSSRRIVKTNILVLSKTSPEDVCLRRICSFWPICLEDISKTSSEDEDERRLQDVFIETNVW